MARTLEEVGEEEEVGRENRRSLAVKRLADGAKRGKRGRGN